MFAKGTRKQKIKYLSEFYRKRYRERNFKFRAVEVNSTIDQEVLVKLIQEITLSTDYRIMKFEDTKGDYFIICKL